MKPRHNLIKRNWSWMFLISKTVKQSLSVNIFHPHNHQAIKTVRTQNTNQTVVVKRDGLTSLLKEFTACCMETALRHFWELSETWIERRKGWGLKFTFNY